VARDLGPADLAEIELDGIVLGGIALAEGSTTSHAAIVARSLGVPLVVGLGEGVLALADQMTVVLDGSDGLLVASPGEETLRQARAALARQEQRRARLALGRDEGAIAADGHRIRLLVNAGTDREVVAGLAAGAEGVGLLRTELAFLDAAAWPTVARHETALRPILQHLAGRRSRCARSTSARTRRRRSCAAGQSAALRSNLPRPARWRLSFERCCAWPPTLGRAMVSASCCRWSRTRVRSRQRGWCSRRLTRLSGRMSRCRRSGR
jgi:hypothetical protein